MTATATATGTPPSAPASSPAALTTGLDESVRTIIALAIALGGLTVIIGAWALRPVSDAEAVSSVMTGLMGGVLGYYFGASGKAKSDSTADKATAKADATTRDAAARSDRAKAAAMGAATKIAEARGKLKVVGASGGGVQIRAETATRNTAEEAAMADLDDAIAQLAQV